MLDDQTGSKPGSHTKLPLQNSQPFTLGSGKKKHTRLVPLLLDRLLESGVPILVVDDESVDTILTFVCVGFFLCPDLLEVRVMPFRYQCLAPGSESVIKRSGNGPTA